MDFLRKLKLSLQVRLSLIVLIVMALVLAGIGLMEYFKVYQTDSDPRAAKMFIALLVFGLLMIIFLMFRAVRNMKHLRDVTAANDRLENELKIANSIQMAMIPKIFPPYPERKDLDVYACMTPAKEVGGDLYDFYIRDEKLYFCIGDVSGKGVPASLVMAVTRSMFRTVSAHEKSPQRIVTYMNDSMADMNENNMFVTFFTGVLDLTSGHLRYCNAGHNAPVVINADGGAVKLKVVPNLPLGVMPGMIFREQETDMACNSGIFLYTDGLNEAENDGKALFGEERMMECLGGGGNLGAEALIKAMMGRVEAFTGDNEQSDDLTMLCIRYLNDPDPETGERHLILHNDIQQIPQLASFVEAIAEEKKIDQSMAMNLNLALEEAVTNVILYAYPEGSDGLVDIEAILRRESLEFIISDSGIPFDPVSVPDADISLGLDDRPVGGLGIHLVKSLMDSVKYERRDGKNILSMTKKI